MNNIQIYVHGENFREPRLTDVPDSATITEVLAIYEKEFPGNGTAADAAVFIEDTDEPLPKDIRIDKAGIKKRMHIHCHRCRKIAVSVFYNGDDKVFHFSPSTTAKVILKKAAKAFEINEADAGDYLLKLDDKTILQPSDHIGSFSKFPACQVKLFLTATKPVQG